MSERRTSPRFQDAKMFPLVEGVVEVEDGFHWPVNIDNLSLEGALLEMPEWQASKLMFVKEVFVKLTLEEKVVWGTGTIQHITPGSIVAPKTSKVGVLFEKLETKDGKNSNHLLGEMVRALDRYQLRQRATFSFSE